MALVYGDEPRTSKGPSTPISQWSTPAVMRAWETHVGNRAYLAFLYARGTLTEKAQAGAELKICERKITFWERHPAFDRPESARILAAVRAAWAGGCKR